MNHAIMITVDGYSWTAVAKTHNNGTAREILTINCDDTPMYVHALLNDALLTVHDVLEVARNYLNDTATRERSAQCGTLTLEWAPYDEQALRDDLLGKTFHVKVVDTNGGEHAFDVGACNPWAAKDACEQALGVPVRSCAIIPQVIQ